MKYETTFEEVNDERMKKLCRKSVIPRLTRDLMKNLH